MSGLAIVIRKATSRWQDKGLPVALYRSALEQWTGFATLFKIETVRASWREMHNYSNTRTVKARRVCLSLTILHQIRNSHRVWWCTYGAKFTRLVQYFGCRPVVWHSLRVWWIRSGTMRARLLATSIFIMSIVLLALATGRVIPAAVQGRSASPAALASASDAAVAAPDLGESPPFTPTRDNRPPISKNEQEEHSNHYETYAALTHVEWDDCDSHKWIAEPTWGDGIEVDWMEFDSRKTLRAKITPAGNSWALMRTDAFPAENWEAYTGLRADIYQVGGASGIDIKLEVRGPQFDPPDLIQTIYCYNLQPDTWNACTWSFDTVGNDYGAVAHLSIVFDDLGGTGPTFYVDNLRLDLDFVSF